MLYSELLNHPLSAWLARGQAGRTSYKHVAYAWPPHPHCSCVADLYADFRVEIIVYFIVLTLPIAAPSRGIVLRCAVFTVYGPCRGIAPTLHQQAGDCSAANCVV